MSVPPPNGASLPDPIDSSVSLSTDTKSLSRCISQRDIARAAGVSAYTVSLALRDHPEVAAKTREKVRRIADEMGYKLDPIMSSAMSRVRKRPQRAAGGLLAVLVAGTRWHIRKEDDTSQALEGIKSECERLGFECDIIFPSVDYKDQERLAKVLDARGIVGAIFVGVAWSFEASEAPGPPLERLLGDTPRSFVGLKAMGPQSHWHVGPDIWNVTVEAVRRTVQQGYCRPGLVHLLDGYMETDTLIPNAYRAACEIYLPGEPRIEPLGIPRGYGHGRFQDWYQEYQPDCVLSFCPMISDILHANNFLPGRDFAFVSHEPLQEFPEATYFDPDWHDAGRLAVAAIFAALQRTAVGMPPLPGRMALRPRWKDGNTLPKKSREENDGFYPLDLNPVTNQGVRGRGSWYDDKYLYGITPGDFNRYGIPFSIPGDPADPASTQCLMMRSASMQKSMYGKMLPLRTDIPVSREAHKVYFLHSCGNTNPQEYFARYRFIMKNGKPQTVKIHALGSTKFLEHEDEVAKRILQCNIQDWWPTHIPVINAKARPIVLTEESNPSYLRRLYLLEVDLENPGVIESIEIESEAEARSTLAVLGITLA